MLLIYCDIGTDGKLSGTESGLRELVRDSGAKVTVVATANQAENYREAIKRKAYGATNLVVTLDRCGAEFPEFFKELFTLMMAGRAMPMAWVKLVPQIPGGSSKGPSTLFLPELGQVRFKRASG